MAPNEEVRKMVHRHSASLAARTVLPLLRDQERPFGVLVPCGGLRP